MKSIRSKVLASIILITFFTAASIALVFYENTAQMVEDNYVDGLYRQVRFLTDTVDETLKDICNINIHASCDNEIVEFLCGYPENGNEDKLEAVTDRLRGYENRNIYILSVYLLIPEKRQMITSLDYPVCKNEIGRGELSEFLHMAKNASNPVIIDDMVHKGGKLLSFMEAALDENGREIGYI